MSFLADTVLRSWHTLNEFISELREDQIQELLEWEIAHKKRQDIVKRLHQRYTMLHSERVRKELLQQCEE